MDHAHGERQQRSNGDATTRVWLRRYGESGGWPEVLRASLPRNQSNPNLEAAGTFAQLGENDKAFAVLEGMIQARRLMIVYMDSAPQAGSAAARTAL